MTEAAEIYSVMAEAARAAAAEQVLDNVRQKHLTAAASWDALALGKRKMDALRLRRVLERDKSAIVAAQRSGQ
jgi:hypothetical protein